MLNDIQKTVLLNTDVIAVNQDVTPQGRVIIEGDSSVWVRHLSDGSAAVAFYNEDDKPKSIGTTLAAIGLGQAAKATVKDLWGPNSAASPAVPAATGAGGVIANITVRAHSTVVLRVTPAK